ncbi:MAG TPA: hypothetical protein VKU41_11755 [Polyangiaceae bacterium]|nr:hypothetical protein [Polyangiaceae bacterium]
MTTEDIPRTVPRVCVTADLEGETARAVGLTLAIVSAPVRAVGVSRAAVTETAKALRLSTAIGVAPRQSVAWTIPRGQGTGPCRPPDGGPDSRDEGACRRLAKGILDGARPIHLLAVARARILRVGERRARFAAGIDQKQ